MDEQQKPRGLRPCTKVWLALMGITLITYGVGRLGLDGVETSLLVLGLALVKGQLVGDWFMGLGRVRGLWRWPVTLWLFVPGSLIALAFLLTE